MKRMRWISYVLITALLLSMLCGCKTTREEVAVADEWVEVEKTENQDAETVKKPLEDQNSTQNAQTQAPSDPTSDQEDQPDSSQDPADQNGSAETPDQTTDPGAAEMPGEEEPESIEKEESGTAITLLSQNVKHAGVKLGTKGDGTGNDIYNRLRRFKALVQNHDPDVIFFQEARIGTIQFFTVDDPYFTQT